MRMYTKATFRAAIKVFTDISKEFEEASKYEGLSLNYLVRNDLDRGICKVYSMANLTSETEWLMDDCIDAVLDAYNKKHRSKASYLLSTPYNWLSRRPNMLISRDDHVRGLLRQRAAICRAFADALKEQLKNW